MNPSEIEIILVEDNQDDAALTIRALRSQNLFNSILHLKNGEEAINYIFNGAEFEGRKFNDNPKVVLLDLKMPKVNGIEVLEQLKTNLKTKSIPVVVLTSSAEDPDIKRCYELGANSYIVKPVGFDNFSKTVVDLGLYWLVMNQTEK
jgi:two-component system response regulator